jgi:hypothetical protein
LVEPLALDQLHRVENAAIRERSDIVHGHNAGMLKSRQHQRLANQPLGEFAVFTRHVQDFQRDTALQFFIFGDVHHAHAAAGHALQKTVARAGEIGNFRSFAQML